MSFPPISMNAAEMLTGRTLDGGWRVIERLPRHPEATGGTFSVGYIVEDSDGRRGFCKALDYYSAFNQPAAPDAVHLATELYIFERDLHRKCNEYRMSKIVSALADGSILVPGCPIPRVDYIIFELADSDIRHQLNLEPNLEAVLRFRALHHVAVGLRQLHQHHIAHQDVKPSNVLSCTEINADKVSKLGDLGRATDAKIPAFHDGMPIAGDPNYAPPEQLYGLIYDEFGPRRYACDLYQLGSLATFMFTGATMNSLILAELDPGYSWQIWPGTYADVLPYVHGAFGNVIEKIHNVITAPFADSLIGLIQCLCEPNPLDRGHLGNRVGVESPYALQRVVTQLDRMARIADRPVLARQL
jgi:serine/threonine protein kinase